MMVWLFIFSCIVLWYLWVTLKVGFKGARDIKHMIRNLKDQEHGA